MATTNSDGKIHIPGLCGWVGGDPADMPPGDALSAMAADLGGRGEQVLEGGAALFLSPGTPWAGLAAEDGILAAIDGYPRWMDPDLAALAAARGSGPALIEAYRRHGKDLVQGIHGAFVLAVIDTREARAVVAIDRMGIHPLCHAQAGAATVFGSTTGAVGAHPGVGRAVSAQGLYDYFFFYRVPGPETAFKAQKKLLPAQRLAVGGGAPGIDFYWQVPFEDTKSGTVESLRPGLFAAMRDSVGRAVADEDHAKTGAFLSGGLDSSTVAGVYNEHTKDPAKAFTIGFDEEGYDESDYARAAASHFGLEHHIYKVTPQDVVDVLPRMAQAFDEPFGNASAVPVYYCAKLAVDNGIDLLLAGDGGDELFAGNDVYRWMNLFQQYYRVPGPLRSALEPLLFNLPGGDRFPLTRKAKGYISRAKVPMPERMFSTIRAVLAEHRPILHPDLMAQVDLDQPINVLRDVYERPQSTHIVHRMHQLDQQVILADNDLRKVKRMCELAGVRVRFPFLDEVVVDYAAKVPPGLLLKGMKLRHFFRQAVNGYLPDVILAKRKHGFGLPIDPWMAANQGALGDFVLDCVENLKGRGVLAPELIEDSLRRHKEGNELYAGGIWDLMTLELWFRYHT
ncbi:MAG: hypothetical protein KDE22_08600 [Rhodobacterales bacterium]|nr:hypothetical protein [Rhodobacterales bacterium]